MRRITSIVVSVCLLLSFSTLTTAQEKSGEVLVRVLDVGAAHASIIRVATPDKSNPAKQQHRYFLYDTGFYDQPLEGATAHGDTAVSAKRGIEEFIPKGSEIDLLVESHSHSDHIGATTWVLQNYKVKRTLRTGFNYASPNETAEFKLTDAAIRQKVKDDKDFTDTCLADLTKDHEKENPAEYPWIGKQIAAVNGMTLTIVSGFGKPLPAWEKAFSEAIDKNIIPFRPRAEWDEATKKQRRQSSLDGYRLNSVSIVVRLDYAGHSVLFTGDEIGKYFSSPDDVSVAAEAFMLSNKDHVSIDTDVLIAGHHGADNSSSLPFVKAVSPDYVIFPAGHMHGHPAKGTAERIVRYLSSGGIEDPAKNRIFRTDLGDDEDDKYEWENAIQSPHFVDPIGDDDIDIVITADDEGKNSKLKVGYRRDINPTVSTEGSSSK